MEVIADMANNEYSTFIDPATGVTHYINKTTGEIDDFDPHDVIIISKGEVQKRKQFLEKVRLQNLQKSSSVWKERGYFVWNLYQISRLSFPNLTASNITRLIYLATYLGYDGYLVNQKSKPLSKNDVFQLLNISLASCKRFFNEMTKNNILLIKNEKIYVNKDVFRKGSVKSKEVALLATKDTYFARLYNNGIRKIYRNSTPSSHKSLSYIFQILPFVNREYNIVCHNPLETRLEHIQSMTLGEFCEIIGYEKINANRLWRGLFEPKFEINSKSMSAISYVVNEIGDKSTWQMFINPNVYYMGDHWKNVEVLGCFG